jgi:signal transduction histidine kinase
MGGSVSMLFFPAVILPAVYGGYGPGIFAAVLATTSIAYFFIPPVYTIELGSDDAIRVCVFAAVGSITAWLSARRLHAEQGQLQSLRELERNLQTLQRVSGWPVVIGPDAATSVNRVLTHAAGVVGARAAAVAWETDDEPWVYIASTAAAAVVKEPVSGTGEWQSEPPHPDIVGLIGDDQLKSASFETEHVGGRAYFSGVSETSHDLLPTLSLVAREIGTSLSQLHLTERIRQLAVREDRIRVSRDLHDGVLQGLTGVRLELKSIAGGAGPTVAERLCALERVLAIEQRELRTFIDDLKPRPRGVSQLSPVASRLHDTCARQSAEWKIPVTIRVTPADMTLPSTVEQALRLMIHEGVSNALKHGHPSRVSVDVEAGEVELRIAIVDDGLGFSFQGRLDDDELDTFVGVPRSLRDRVSALDGRLSIESRPAGSRIEVVIPLTAQRRASA